MRVLFKSGVIALIPETPDDRQSLDGFGGDYAGHVFHLGDDFAENPVLHDLGARADACREPINITIDTEEQWRPISNLAFTPFVFDGRYFSSVEGFWQGLKFSAQKDRDRIALLHGTEAKHAGDGTGTLTHITWHGAEIPVGGPEHWTLMREVCRAKFTVNDEARAALLSTGSRPLMHRVRRDSRTIPGALLAEFWMQIRAALRSEEF